MKQKIRLWDVVRKRTWIDVTKLSYKQFKSKLTNEFGKKSGITKYFKKEVFLDLKKNLVKKKRGNKFYLATKPKRWQENEIKLLKELGKTFKGKELVLQFNQLVEKPRSYSSILTKHSRIKHTRS